MCVNRSTSFVSYRQCVTCVAEAVVGLLYLKSHYSTTIGVVGLEPKAALFVLILIIVRPWRNATSSIGANVLHSWHFMHKRNGETEEDSRALSLFAASGTQFTSSCWHVCSLRILRL